MTETLWDFAVARYQRAAVAECCLRLQDTAGADVNMLLTAAWLAQQHHCWQHEQVRDLIAVCAEWRERCVLPLRAVRRYLKQQSEPHALYEQAKALELSAEIQQLHLLHNALQGMAPTTNSAANTADSLAINLQTYFDCICPNQLTINAADRRELIAALSP